MYSRKKIPCALRQTAENSRKKEGSHHSFFPKGNHQKNPFFFTRRKKQCRRAGGSPGAWHCCCWSCFPQKKSDEKSPLFFNFRFPSSASAVSAASAPVRAGLPPPPQAKPSAPPGASGPPSDNFSPYSRKISRRSMPLFPLHFSAASCIRRSRSSPNACTCGISHAFIFIPPAPEFPSYPSFSAAAAPVRVPAVIHIFQLPAKASFARRRSGSSCRSLVSRSSLPITRRSSISRTTRYSSF